MAVRDPVEVTVEIDGAELTAGTLWVHVRGGQSATFRYADSYLANPASYDVDPTLPKASGVFHTAPGAALFGAFADSAPDRWGENLMRREERERAKEASAKPRTLGAGGTCSRRFNRFVHRAEPPLRRLERRPRPRRQGCRSAG